MRRHDREIKNIDDIVDVLSRCSTIRLGINGDACPYIVPLSFGFESVGGQVTIYFHGACEGLKHELLAKAPDVCVEADICHRFVETAHGVTAEYESVIGFGKAERVYGSEAEKGLDLLLEHCGFPDYCYNRSALEVTAVYKIILLNITDKRMRL